MRIEGAGSMGLYFFSSNDGKRRAEQQLDEFIALLEEDLQKGICLHLPDGGSRL